ncbi:MAG: cbb3-type cytochrome c oxidase subunit I, partial [Gemmatimonadales bacterium]
AGFYYWWPKEFGHKLNEKLGRWNFWVQFVGLNLAFFPMHFSGLLGMPRRIYTYAPELGVEGFNLLSTIGTLILVVGVLVFIYNVFYSRTNGEKADKNPWGGATLEWATASPPPVYNFSVLPVVHSRLPLWMMGGVDDIPDAPPEPVHVPGGSIWPLLVAVGIIVVATAGLLHSIPLAIVGAVATAVSIYRWLFEPFEM